MGTLGVYLCEVRNPSTVKRFGAHTLEMLGKCQPFTLTTTCSQNSSLQDTSLTFSTKEPTLSRLQASVGTQRVFWGAAIHGDKRHFLNWEYGYLLCALYRARTCHQQTPCMAETGLDVFGYVHRGHRWSSQQVACQGLLTEWQESEMGERIFVR